MRRLILAIALALALSTLLTIPKVPARAATPRLTLLGRGFGSPDDLAWGPHGSIYFVDFGNSSLNVLRPNGQRQVLISRLAEPEGIVVLPDGTLVVAEQGPNQLLHINPLRRSTRVLAGIPNPTTQAGIDGIALDARDNSIVVPDSPSGRVLRVTLPGSTSPAGRVTVLARGLGRPVGALVEPNGGIIVVDEHLNGAFRIDRNGAAHQVGGFLSVPDDILGDGHGGFYVTCLGDGTLRHVNSSGTATLVARGLAGPQGLLRRADGTLIVAEEQRNAIVAIHV
jgi:sugar lactone lactonase YvrE